jgi:uncharacterized protein YdeI (YjbR/CyaY-like superfamily)
MILPLEAISHKEWLLFVSFLFLKCIYICCWFDCMEIDLIYPHTAIEWRDWLTLNHATSKGVWVQMPSKRSGLPGINWRECVEQALCFGWIDSKKVNIDHQFSRQYVSPRKPKSTWSKVNKELIQRLTESGRMHEAGMKCVECAKQNGSWHLLESIDALLIPGDLAEAFNLHMGSRDRFEAKSKSFKKLALTNLLFAKTVHTRQKRIEAILLSIYT